MAASEDSQITGPKSPTEPELEWKAIMRPNGPLFALQVNRSNKDGAEYGGMGDHVPIFNIFTPRFPLFETPWSETSSSENHFAYLVRSDEARSVFRLPIMQKKSYTKTNRRSSELSVPVARLQKHLKLEHRTSSIFLLLPLEIWIQIMTYLPRKDILSLRLTNRTVSDNVSSKYGKLFRRAVVPFRRGIYGLLSEDADAYPLSMPPSCIEATGKSHSGTAKEQASLDGGLDMFRQFGDHFREFCIRFHVTEYELNSKLDKHLPKHIAFWGAYHWPSPVSLYTKSISGAKLEEIADETSSMRKAFSYLQNLDTLAFDLDCGCGWLEGPDISVRSQIIDETGNVFSGKRFQVESVVQARRDLWKNIEFAYGAENLMEIVPHATMRHEVGPQQASKSVSNPSITGQDQTKRVLPFIVVHKNTKLPRDENLYAWDRTVSGTFRPRLIPNTNHDSSPRRQAKATVYSTLLWSEPGQQVDAAESHSRFFNANSSLDGYILGSGLVEHPTYCALTLSVAQKDYLLESHWIADSLLSTQIIAVIDNNVWSQNLRKIILRMNGCLVPKLHRNDFWDALSGLADLSVRIIPSWRRLKSHDGSTTDHELPPSCSISDYHKLLATYISKIKHINKLEIGWEGGGEHARGTFARNRHVLPAPICKRSDSVNFSYQYPSSDVADLPKIVVIFQHVEELTFYNCWISPEVIRVYARVHVRSDFHLRKLTLDSVSMICHPSFPPRHHHMGNGYYTAQQATLQRNSLTGFRHGSWPDLFVSLDEAFLKMPPRIDFQITFLSCGHVRIGFQFDQTALSGMLHQAEAAHYPHFTFWSRRRAYLFNKMIRDDDMFLGRISLVLLPDEAEALIQQYHMSKGWPSVDLLPPDYDDDEGWGRYGKETEKAAFYDGCPRGGTGRFSGRLSWDRSGLRVGISSG